MSPTRRREQVGFARTRVVTKTPVSAPRDLLRLAEVAPQAPLGLVGVFLRGWPPSPRREAIERRVRACCSPFDRLLELPEGYVIAVQGGERRLAKVRAELRRQLQPLAGQVELRFALGAAGDARRLVDELAHPAPLAG